MIIKYNNFKKVILESNDLNFKNNLININYSKELTKEEFINIKNKYCKIYNDNNVIFYRGDKSLNKKYYLIKSKKTKNQMVFDFNHITTRFISSKLWDNKNYPLKKNSLNMTHDKNLANFFGNGNIFTIIPFDDAKIICLPRLFGNYQTEKFKKEFNYYFRDPSDLASFLSELVGGVTLNTVDNKIKKLEKIFNNTKPKELSELSINRRGVRRRPTDDELFHKIINGMKNHNMNFLTYMEHIFAPENYIIKDYKNLTNSFLKNYTAEYTDSNVLMINTNLINEHITSSYIQENITSARWGNIGAGVLPYCEKTKRFLIAHRSNYVMEPNTWGVWGGKVDNDDMNNIKKTTLREFKEETGYNNYIKLISSFIYKEIGFIYYNFVGLIENEFNPTLNWETQNYKWVNLDELMKIEPKHFGLKLLLDKLTINVS